jgi:hypothetical protein
LVLAPALDDSASSFVVWPPQPSMRAAATAVSPGVRAFIAWMVAADGTSRSSRRGRETKRTTDVATAYVAATRVVGDLLVTPGDRGALAEACSLG